ncbi:MAG: choice-of-anchor V domain-containing protein [Bacteroidota bacterium]
MKRNHILFGLLVCSSILFLANSSGSPLGRTGAPGDSTCGSSSCHSVAPNQEDATVTINFGDEAITYRAGETYKVDIGITGAQNAARNGFQIVALNAADENVGEWILTNTDETQIRSSNSNGRNYVTHTRAGNSQAAWTMNWQAPAEDAGQITFYLALLDANGANGSRGDHLYTVSQAISLDVRNSTATVADDALRLFPIPAKDVLNIQYDDGIISTYSLYDKNGQRVRQSTFQPSIEVGDLSNGLYILELETKAGRIYRKVMVQH